MIINSQIVDLKMIRKALVLIKCYQCGGETLGPVVKHPVRDSISTNDGIKYLRRLRNICFNIPETLQT